MYTFLLMLEDLFNNNNMHWFFLFFCFILIRWLIVFVNAFRYKPYIKKRISKKPFTSVIIPVVDEPIDVFSKAISKISQQKPNEIIVVINGPKNPQLKSACRSHNLKIKNKKLKWTKIKVLYTPIAGKRNAIRLGLEKTNKKSEISILVDSDTIWVKNTLRELIKPFVCDDKVGGVTTRQKIYQPNRNLITMFASILEEIRAEGTMKAMSVYGKVGCLPGRTIAFKTDILHQVMEEFMNEEFMGIHKEVSDDRSLTNLTLKNGYKTIMQDTSIVYTDAPTNWKKFIRQQLRWAEGSQYNNIRMTFWMLKNSKLMLFIYWTDMIMPMLLISVYVNIVFCFVFNKLGLAVIDTIVYKESVFITLLFIFFGAIFSFGARNMRVLKNLSPRYLLLIPVFIIILTIVMVPVRIFGLMRCADGIGWGTRKLSNTT